MKQERLRIDAFVSESRLWALLMELAQYGATTLGGVNRQAFSPEDLQAKKAVVAWAAARGFRVFQDEMANLFVRREGQEPNLEPVIVGSHLDSQPAGGKFDGAFGVAAGLEILDALEQAKWQTRRPLEIVSWSNEEGSRFSPGAMGSAVFSGRRSVQECLGVRDTGGAVLGECLQQTIENLPIPFRSSIGLHPFCYLEGHIEQGPALEKAGVSIGVVKSIQGIRRFEVEVSGEEGHAGTVPMRARKDALVHAMRVAQALAKLALDPADVIRLTIGRFQVFPGSPNTIPGRVVFSIDLRHPDGAVLDELGHRILRIASNAQQDCAVTVKQISFIRPTIFADLVVNAIRDAAMACGYESLEMNSGAGHDAMHLETICPAGMVFIPCLNGISHNEKESISAGDAAAGATVLAEAALRLAS